MNPDSTLAVTNTCPKDGVHLSQRAFLVQGDDRLGTFADIHRKLFDAQVNVYASTGITDGKGDYGCVLYIKAEHFKNAAHALGLDPYA